MIDISASKSLDATSSTSCNVHPALQIDLTAENTESKSNLHLEQKFRKEWKQQFSWLESVNNKAFCKYCNISITNKKPHLFRHDNSKKHKKVILSLKNQPNFKTNTRQFQSKCDKVKIAELRIIVFILQHNLPFLIISPLIELVKSVAMDSEIVKQLKLGKTKATKTVNSILLNDANTEIAQLLKKQNFSIIVDETTDISTSKCLAIVARYYDWNLSKVRDRFLALLELKSYDSHSVYDTVRNCFKNLMIPFENCIGFASDNASVMIGKNNSVKALFLKDNLYLFSISCLCHSLHLCSSAAANMLPRCVDTLVRNIYLYFSHSPKRQNEFKDFQEHFNIKEHKILKISRTRWLSLEQVVCRVLEQWPALQHYFLSTTFENSTSNADFAEYIQRELNDVNKFYLLFLSYILKITNELNLEFQSESIRIHVILAYMKTYYKKILHNFVEKEFINENILYDCDFNDTKILKDEKNTYCGAKAELFLQSINFSDDEVLQMRGNCRKYCIKLCKGITKRIDFGDSFLNALQGINPACLSESLTPIIGLLLNLTCEEEREELDSEWRTLIMQELIPNEFEFEKFWTSVFNLKNGLNEIMFPKLRTFVSSLLCLPHSSAAAERIFSQLFLIKNKTRNKLHVSTINSIMACKELLNGKDCSSWEPSNEVIKNYLK